jgi:hypothetical protein
MNTRPDHDVMQDHRTTAFDAAARAAHTEALQHVSTHVQAQLQQRRRGVLAGDARKQRPQWLRAAPIFAISGTAAIALAIGLRFVGNVVDTPAHTTADARTTPHAAAQKDDAASTRSSAQPAPIAYDRVTDDTATLTTDSQSSNGSDTAPQGIIDANALETETLASENDGESSTNNMNLPAENEDSILDEALFASLDENPDLYLWLSSDESLSGPAESL